MTEFLETALSMPTLAFTSLLGVMLLYWVSVMVGALDLDVLDPGGALDGVDGALDGVDGALDGADGALDGADGAADGADGADADGDLGDAGPHGFAGLLHALRLRYAPLTVVLSGLALFGWIASFVASRYLAPILPLPGFVTGLIVAVAALLVAWPLTSLVTRPMAPLFKMDKAKSNRDLIGQVVTVKTGRVDAGFGQAKLEDGQASMLLKVRCEDPDALGRGDRALIVDWDEETGAFDVEPMEAIVDEPPPRRRGQRRAR